ncbi:probetacellulin-like [Myxocyprinus asiaticus]|uniref:probetacellulin-like n=1 Tax=Myxocyprinus asiaticus TaxID=70543 RepID=UPI002222EAF9|nr:probetacellulin-like [Myxocyprinus asiaticus]XP_051533521.1 probetacellulin-like [Myxocyprinus asiaticus]XP_051533522.1 probetacellulin-like [Myxocyprinus asiaticus]
MDCRLLLGIITAVAICKYTQAEWNTTTAPAKRIVSCDPHNNRSNCTDSNDDHRWNGHFSKCPKEYKHFCINGACRFVKEQNTPSCRCENGFIGSRCEYSDISFLVGERKKIVIICVITGLVFLILLIVFICICTQKRYKPCRKKRRKKETRAEVEKLSSLTANESLTGPVDTSITNAV